MTKHPQSVDNTGFNTSDPEHPQNLPTQPAQYALGPSGERLPPPVVTKRNEDLKRLRDEYKDAPTYALDMLATARRIEIGQFELEKDLTAVKGTLETHSKDIQKLKARTPADSFSNEVDSEEAVSKADMRREMRRSRELAEARTIAQTEQIKAEAKAAQWRPVLAMVTTITLAFIAQHYATKSEVKDSAYRVEQTVKESTKEAAKEAVKEAKEDTK